MVSNKPPYGFNEISAAEMKKIPLPDKFLCRECKKWKGPLQYSNKQTNEYRYKVFTNQHITNTSAELRCRNCTGDQTQELHCQGPCALWKGLEDFSKNQRRRPENAWCASCTQWKEANEPGVTPAAAPNNLLSPDEEREVVESDTGFGAYATDDIEGEADSEEEDDGFIYATLATTTIADNGMAGPKGRPGKAPGSNPTNSALPAYLTGTKMANNVVNIKSSPSNPFATRSVYTGEGGKQRSENNLPDNAANGKNHPHNTGMGYGAAGGKWPKTGVAYNAWDNLGQMHNQYRAPSQTTGLTSSTGLQSRSDVRPLSSGLAKQASAGTRPSDNQNRPDARPAASGQSGGWAKQTLATRNPPPQFPTLSRPVRQNIYDDGDDGDDSPDEI